MKKRLWVTFLALLGVFLLAGLPLLPTSFLFSFQPLAYDKSRNASALAEEEVGKVLNAVRNHDHYGVPEGSSRLVSLHEYLVNYDRVGILSIQDTDEIDRRDRCASCSIKVVTGLVCRGGGFCGFGATFYLRLDDGAWTIQEYSLWVS